MRDVALFLDVVGGQRSPESYRTATQQPPQRLRIAVSTPPPPGTQASLSAANRQAVETTVALLRDLGHDVVDAEIDYGLGSLWNSTVRLLKGVRQDAGTVPNPDGLERRTRQVARLARLVPTRALAKAQAREAEIAVSINRVFEAADVVLTPLCGSPAPRIDDCPTSGALRSLRASNTSAWLAPWNVTGQPAMSVPVGLDTDGMPAAVQLAGRPNDEATLLRLAAHIEANRPFPRWSRQQGPSPTPA